MSEIKNPGKSIRAKLLNVAKQKDVFYQTILTRYFQERLLYRISQTHYRENFYLKGGALMYAYEHFAARPTLDIDFLGTHISNDGERIAEAFREICAVECEEDGVRFAADMLPSSFIVYGSAGYLPAGLFISAGFAAASMIVTFAAAFCSSPSQVP